MQERHEVDERIYQGQRHREDYDQGELLEEDNRASKEKDAASERGYGAAED